MVKLRMQGAIPQESHPKSYLCFWSKLENPSNDDSWCSDGVSAIFSGGKAARVWQPRGGSKATGTNQHRFQAHMIGGSRC